MQAKKGRKITPTGKDLIKIRLLKLWHLPDSFNWMSPLPYPHRWGIILATLLLLGAFFWPSPTPEIKSNNNTATPIDLATSAGQKQPQSTPAVANSSALNHPVYAQSIEPKPTQTQKNLPAETLSSARPVAKQTTQTTSGQWKEFTIQKGQTLTQLFRDNNYTTSDVFLMTKVEGQGQPLNALRIGQKVKVKITKDKRVTALEVQLTPNRSALFTRQSNGRFKRER